MRTRPGRLQKRVTHYANRQNCGTTQHSLFCEKNNISVEFHANFLLCTHFVWFYFLRTVQKTEVAQWLRCCVTNRKVAGSIPAGVSGFFIDIKSFRSHYGPGVDSASNRNEYQDYFLGGKGGRCVKLTTLPPSCAVVTKSRNLNFLRTLWACPGL